METILVTGGTGFVGSYSILELLRAGYRVRTTVRNLKKEAEVRSSLKTAGIDAGDRLSFFQTDLNEDEGWSEAVAGCDYVWHVASPFPLEQPKDENELIVPAREGALRVLRASREAGVKRVVLTSSFAAIGYGHPPDRIEFDETSWTNTDSETVPAYHKSKTLAERAAWDFMQREAGNLELAVVNPVGIFGPVLGKDLCSSIEIVKTLLDGGLPACPRIYFGVVDVRDVVDLHLRAMTHAKAKGERFLAVADRSTSLIQMARLLKERLGEQSKNVPTREMPDWLLRVFALFIPKVRGAVTELGKVRNGSNAKAKRLLGWQPRPSDEAILATAESLVQFGLLKK